jgi:TDG/mug DNA glycosylase family protein
VSTPYGKQAELPAGWPLPPTTEVWVLTSTSGACPLTNAAREAPYSALSERLKQISWPRQDVPRCKGQGMEVR